MFDWAAIVLGGAIGFVGALIGNLLIYRQLPPTSTNDMVFDC
jgi:hypothetical protein